MKENGNNRPHSNTDWQSASDWFNQRQNERINTKSGKYDPYMQQKRAQEEQIERQRTRSSGKNFNGRDNGNIRQEHNAGKNESIKKKDSKASLSSNNKRKTGSKSKDELRREHAEKTRKRRKRRIIEWFVFTALIFAAIFVVASLTVLFRIEDISVEGDTRYCAEQVIEASKIEIGDNLWRTRASEVSPSVASSLPYVGKVTITRKIPSKIILNVEETVPVYAVKKGSRYILIDITDKVLEINSKSFEKLIIIDGLSGFGAVSEGEKFEIELMENYTTAKDVVRYAQENELNITKISVGDINDISAVCDKKIRLDFGSATQLSEKMIMANEVVTKLKSEGSLNEGVINLKSTTKAFYKDGSIETTKAAVTNEPVTDENGNTVTTELVSGENGENVTNDEGSTKESSSADSAENPRSN